MSEEKIALITGGNYGPGRDMAIHLAKGGINIILTYHSKKEEADKVVKEIEQLGKKAVAIQLDTGRIDSFDYFFFFLVHQVLLHKFETDKFDYLINNAGASLMSPFGETTETDFDELVNVHYKGVYFLTQTALSFLNDNGGIVNVSSGLTRLSHPGIGVYASTKAAIEVLTCYMAEELSSREINVNVVALGAMAPYFDNDGIKNNIQMQPYWKNGAAIPVEGQLEDIGSVVAFLCSDEAKWVNAQRIEVSAGKHL